MKVIIRSLAIATLCILGLLAMEEQGQFAPRQAKASSPPPITETSPVKQEETAFAVIEKALQVAHVEVEHCPESLEFFASPNIKAIDLDDVQMKAIADTLCVDAEPVVIPTNIILEPNRIYYGQSAIEVVRQREGELTPEMKHIIIEEGYVLGDYHDKGEVYASGVGQTGKFKGQSFKETFIEHRQRAVKMFPELDTYSEELRMNIISSVYRGGISGSPKASAYLRAGQFEAAAAEFLDNNEYRTSLASGDGVAQRMKRLADAMLHEQTIRDKAIE